MTTSTPTPITDRRNSPAFLAGMGVLCAGALAAIVTAVLLAFGGHADAAAPPPAPTPSHGQVLPHPSATVETLQRELGQLNYYEGPIDGTMNPQTVQAITYLQRDAHLPQTGHAECGDQRRPSRTSWPTATTRWAADRCWHTAARLADRS